MLALDHYEAALCRKCGHSLGDTTDPDTDPDNPASSRRWVAEVPAECYCCKVLARSERKIADDDNNRIPTEALIHTAVLAHRPRSSRPGRGQP